MEEIFKILTLYIAMLTEVGAAIVIGFAALQATFQAILTFFVRSNLNPTKENIRINLARWLSLGLEFELAADILRTAVTPTWNEIGQLAAIIILRTFLNFFLQKEIDRTSVDVSAQ